MFHKSADTFLENAMKTNPYYPFEEFQVQATDAPVYIYSARYGRFYWSLVIVVVSCIFTLLWPIIGKSVQFCIFSVFILTVSGFYVLEYQHKRTIVHDPTSKYFTVYCHGNIIACRPVTDLFIKMNVKDIGSNGLRYHLVIDGNGLELPMPLPGETANRKKLRSLAYKLANNLNINYFDINERSRHLYSSADLINHEKTLPTRAD